MEKLQLILNMIRKDKTTKLLCIVVLLVIVAVIGLKIYGAVTGKTVEEPLQDEETGDYIGEFTTGLKESELETDHFYIKHNDLYYELAPGMENFDEIAEGGTSIQRVLYMPNKTFETIPTLYLGRGDALIYYSTVNSMSWVDFERFTDCGSSIGMYGIYPDPYNKLYYISINPDDDYSAIYEESDAYQVMKAFQTNKDNGPTILSIKSIGETEISADVISKAGIIKGLKADRQYDTKIYCGTVEHDYVLTADTHFFTGMENFAEAIVPFNGSIQEIAIPDYMLNGYYTVENAGVFRLVRESTYTKDTDFNTRLLEISTERDGLDTIESPIEFTATYSQSIKEFNLYVASKEGSFGYVTEEETSEETKEEGSQEEIEIASENEEVSFEAGSAEYSDFASAYEKQFGYSIEKTFETADNKDKTQVDVSFKDPDNDVRTWKGTITNTDGTVSATDLSYIDAVTKEDNSRSGNTTQISNKDEQEEADISSDTNTEESDKKSRTRS